MAPWPRAPVIPQLVDRKTFRDNRWVRHLSLTSCAFRRYSSSKPETDESHLVRDQDYMTDGVGASNQELQYGFALPSPSVVWHCHPTTERQI
ncbi:hypothetical protein TNCV_861261 [Trichonephila clavipes]|nr:hypothetical protein TNCV_861261 [Trichonephila clavipes]